MTQWPSGANQNPWQQPRPQQPIQGQSVPGQPPQWPQPQQQWPRPSGWSQNQNPWQQPRAQWQQQPTQWQQSATPWSQQPAYRQAYGAPGGWPQQPYAPVGNPGPWGQPQPRKKSNFIPVLLMGVGLLLGFLLVRSYFESRNPFGSSTSRPTSSASTSARPDSYANDDYALPAPGAAVSEIPVPDTYDEVDAWVTSNALYNQTLGDPVRCDEPSLTSTSISDARLESYLTGYTECLTRVWGPALEDAGFEAYQPLVTVYPAGGEVVTPCGTQQSYNAFYCSADQNLYVAADVTEVLPSANAAQRRVFDLIIAHEYGHAMQGRSGIFTASIIQTYEGTEAEQAQSSRRTEVQADCMAGLAINSLSTAMGVDDADRASIADSSYEIGDDSLDRRFGSSGSGPGDHGTGANRKLWVERGLASSSVATCNTFTAPASEVE